MDKKRDAAIICKEASDLVCCLENGNDNYIFGNGWMGHKFYDTVTAMGFSICGFVVSNFDGNQNGEIPVYTIDEFSKKAGGKNIFIALRNQEETLTQRLQNMCEQVVPVTYPRDITLIEAKYYVNYFKEKGINCEGEDIVLSGFHFVNPFKKPYDYLLSWAYEAGDLILPVLFNDFARVDEGPYETENMYLKRGDVVLDCGANIGLFSAVAIQKGCKVYAFEPMQDAISYLGELKERFREQLEICPYALAEQRGKAPFYVQNSDLIGASLLENHNAVDKEYQVDVTSIDDFVKEQGLIKVDYIKADIEGAERSMLRGAKKTIQKYLPKIVVCTYHLEDDKAVLESIVKEISDKYVIRHSWKKLYAYVPENAGGCEKKKEFSK